MIDERIADASVGVEAQSRHQTFVGVVMWLVLIGAFVAAASGSHFVFSDQSGVLAFEDRVASICFEGRGVLPLRASQTVLLSGKRSAFGFLVEDIATP